MQRSKLTYGLILMLALLSIRTVGQNAKLDSMRTAVESAPMDTSKIKLYYQLSVDLAKHNAEEARGFGLASVKLSKELNETEWLGKAYRNLANLYSQKPDYDSSFYYYDQSVDVLLETGNLKSLGLTYSNRGSVHRGIGEYGKAKYYYTKYLKITEELGDSSEIASSIGRLGLLSFYEGDFESAIEKYVQVAEIQERMGDSTELAITYSNYAQAKAAIGDHRESIDLYRTSLALFGKGARARTSGAVFNNIGSMFESLDELDSAYMYLVLADSCFVRAKIDVYRGATLSNIGKILYQWKRYDESEQKYLQSISIREEFQDRDGLVGSYSGIAKLYASTGRSSKAISSAKKAVRISEEINSMGRNYLANNALYKVYKELGLYEKAFEQIQYSESLHDSLMDKEKLKSINDLEKRYESDKKAREIELLEKENALRKAELVEADAIVVQKEAKALERGAEFRMILIVSGLVFVLFVLIVIGARTKKKANNKLIKQKKEIEEKNEELSSVNEEINAQNEAIEQRNVELSKVNRVLDGQRLELEIRNKEITDSIHYAKRLQTAILPPKSLVAQLVPDSFVLFMPKDIVSGDFYWIEEKDDSVYFAAVDCTGHGVPGALVSMVGHNGLHRAVHEFGMKTPADILDKLNELVLEALYEDSEQAINDGMDIALCRIVKGSREIEYAGAYNPLYIIPPGDHDDPLQEVRANKRPIGPTLREEQFTNHKIAVPEGSNLYVFSDGFFDQFGGERGKKLKSGAFKKLLVSIQNLDIQKQGEELRAFFETWRGDNEQIDDVCVIGVQV